MVSWGKVDVGVGELTAKGSWGDGNVLYIDWDGCYTGVCIQLSKHSTQMLKIVYVNYISIKLIKKKDNWLRREYALKTKNSSISVFLSPKMLSLVSGSFHPVIFPSFQSRFLFIKPKWKKWEEFKIKLLKILKLSSLDNQISSISEVLPLKSILQMLFSKMSIYLHVP